MGFRQTCNARESTEAVQRTKARAVGGESNVHHVILMATNQEISQHQRIQEEIESSQEAFRICVQPVCKANPGWASGTARTPRPSIVVGRTMHQEDLDDEWSLVDYYGPMPIWAKGRKRKSSQEAHEMDVELSQHIIQPK